MAIPKARGIGLDDRIGAKFLHAGPGFGGSCFPKDTRALAAIGKEHGAPIRLIEQVIEINEERAPGLPVIQDKEDAYPGAEERQKELGF